MSEEVFCLSVVIFERVMYVNFKFKPLIPFLHFSPSNMIRSLIMNSACSNSTISTTASLKCSISSKNMLRNAGSHNTSVKANRNAKYTLKTGSNRWQATAKRDASLKNLLVKQKPSMSSQLGRGLEGMRIESTNKLTNAEFKPPKGAPFAEICFRKDTEGPAISIKSAALNRALHRDIDLQRINERKNKRSDELGQGRWEATKSSDQKNSTGLSQPKRQKSGAALFMPTRQKSEGSLC